jgi:hypothetical protein
MADLSDVENAVVAKVIGAIYPAGISQTSAIGVACRVFRGWPSPANLNQDLAGGTVNVTVFPTNAPDEVPGAYFDDPQTNVPPTSLIATVVGQSITISGPINSNQTIGVLIDGVPFSYSAGEHDTTDSIAANLSALVSVSRISVLSGSTFTIPGSRSLFARTVTNASVSWGLRRQRRQIQTIAWCPSFVLRDAVCKIVDLALGASSFISLPDGTSAHCLYVSTHVYDQSINALLYRRDLCYQFEFTTVNTVVAPVMLFGGLLANQDKAFV